MTMGMFKTVAAATAVTGIVAVNAKLQKKKREGRLTAIGDLWITIPLVIRMKRQMKKMPKRIKLRKMLESPSFRLSDHWECRDTDVICAVPAKSGTTWLLQMCHQVRVGGDPNTNYNQDILDVIPWVEQNIESISKSFYRIPADPAAGPGAYDMDADHAGTDIRCFKTHLPWTALQGLNCKKIYVYRSTVDQLYSFARFRNSLLGINDDALGFINFQIMVGFIEKGLQNLCEFWKHRNDDNVGFFFYDHLKEDHAGSVKRIAGKMGITPTKELIDAVVEQSTVSFMSDDNRHWRFDGFRQLSCIPSTDTSAFPEVSGQPPRGKSKSIKVVKNGGLSSTNAKKNSERDGRNKVERCFRIAWEKIVYPQTGFVNHESMKDAWKEELSK